MWEPYSGVTIKPKRKRPAKPRQYPERDLVHLPLMMLCRHHPILGINKPYLFHVANERKTASWHGAILKALGVKQGVSDLLLLYPSRGYSGMVLELKAPGGRPTESQAAFLEQIGAVGYFTGCFDDPNEAFKMLKWYLNEL